MAVLHLQTSFMINKPLLLHKPTNQKFTKTIIFSQNSPKPTTKNDPITKPIPSSGLGFGPAQQPKPDPSPSSSGKMKNKGRRGRDGIIRRTPVEKPAFLMDKKGVEEKSDEPTLNENAFLLTWLALGILILVQGLALSASGFLPEEWDKLFVKYIYPSFTPTVLLFIAGTVTYGVYKYFQNENARNQN
ncbi:hypothetical protein RND81_14G125700 [Saponaria officinalis]|uniref:Protein LOW PSII ACCUMULATION 2, chloroplastic n=1 Tax=Saponaria officinalis TaxID=3572 RepID=A0AAW1GLP2_SAPOF